jgi:zinc/manganese transport system permease protein
MTGAFTRALLAGTTTAALAGMVGYFLTLRRQLFTGDALSHAAFTAALAALVIGVDGRIGLFVGTVGVAVAMGILGPRGRADDIAIGGVFVWILGIGALLLTIYTTSRSGTNGVAGLSILFGSVLSLDNAHAIVAVVVAMVLMMALAIVARPLLFASVDEVVAAARGIRVTFLSFMFLVIVGATAAEATQVVGALLLLGLLAAPGGAAHRLCTRPFLGLVVSMGFAVGAVWLGLLVSYSVPRVPASSAVIGVATLSYAVVAVRHRLVGPTR